MKWQYTNDRGERIAVGMWVHVLLDCRTSGYARIIEIDDEQALLQAASGGRQHRVPIATLQPAALAPLMQLTLEANFAPPTPKERLMFAREDVERVTEDLATMHFLTAIVAQSSSLTARGESVQRRISELNEELCAAKEAVARLSAEVEGNTQV